MNSELPQGLIGSRNRIRLFALPSTGKAGDNSWYEVPFQLDPVDDEGRFIFFQDEKWRTDKIETNDRLVFHASGFGRRKTGNESPPCKGRISYQLQDKDFPNKFAYLAICEPFPLVTLPSSVKPAVAYLKEKSNLSTGQYTYDFNPKNQMLFTKISVGTDVLGRQLVAEDSELLIKSDVKKFFTMRFDSSQIESYLEETRPGLIGTLARVSFYLKILFFKIKMSLTTDVTFYDDVGHIPMVVQLPVDARKYLNPKSGILYSWKLGPDVVVQNESLRMPLLDPALNASGVTELAKVGLKNCSGEFCQFSFSASVGDKSLAMEFEIPVYMVKVGFFPQLVVDVGAQNKEMGWDLSKQAQIGNRMALYFEVSGLPMGGHPWDFWLRLGANGKLEGTCPRGLNITRQ